MSFVMTAFVTLTATSHPVSGEPNPVRTLRCAHPHHRHHLWWALLPHRQPPTLSMIASSITYQQESFSSPAFFFSFFFDGRWHHTALSEMSKAQWFTTRVVPLPFVYWKRSLSSFMVSTAIWRLVSTLCKSKKCLCGNEGINEWNKYQSSYFSCSDTSQSTSLDCCRQGALLM